MRRHDVEAAEGANEISDYRVYLYSTGRERGVLMRPRWCFDKPLIVYE